ncbi:tail collar domain [Marinoscillum furvescens DSM 4134]|uniref:Tail collar domain n=2 Tax=Marinoscillum furvescens TaxID=1026 RepID=A0A3D9L4J5_MARFU|nr:tail collar domain [Marinoscillum furvescens DSM 4134]
MFMRSFFFLSLCLIAASTTYSQDGVGIGTSHPHSSAILDIHSPNHNRGVLLPTSGPEALFGIKSSAKDGLLFYDTVTHRLTYFYNDKWNYVNPWVTEEIQNNTNVSYVATPFNVSVGTISEPTEALEVNGTVKATQFQGYGVVPIGGIMMWSGSAVPDGYALCDGRTVNSMTTPNLVGRFILAGTGSESTKTGGANDLSTTNVSYERVKEYTIDEAAGCSDHQYRFSGEILVQGSCGDANSYVSFSNVAGNTCLGAGQTYIANNSKYDNCGGTTTRNCTSSSNPNYYRTNSDCYVENYEEVNLVSSTDNRPEYYILAFIMRVE